MPAGGFQGALEAFPARIVAGDAFIFVFEDDLQAHGQAVSPLAFVLLLAAIALSTRTGAVPGIENCRRHRFLRYEKTPPGQRGMITRYQTRQVSGICKASSTMPDSVSAAKPKGFLSPYQRISTSSAPAVLKALSRPRSRSTPTLKPIRDGVFGRMAW